MTPVQNPVTLIDPADHIYSFVFFNQIEIIGFESFFVPDTSRDVDKFDDFFKILKS